MEVRQACRGRAPTGWKRMEPQINLHYYFRSSSFPSKGESSRDNRSKDSGRMSVGLSINSQKEATLFTYNFRLLVPIVK